MALLLLRALVAGLTDETAATVLEALKYGELDTHAERVSTLADLRAALMREPRDVVLLGQTPDLELQAVLAALGELGQDTPIIVIAELSDSNEAAAAMRGGASDYFGLVDLARLAPALEREVRAAQLRAALDQLQKQYQLLVEKVPAGIHLIALDRSDSTLFISPQLERMLGFSLAEWQADPQLWRKQIHPEDLERVLAGWSAIYAPGAEPFLAEYRWRRPDGGIVWIRDETVLVRDAGGRPLHLQSIKLDITDRKQVEAEVHEINKNLSGWVTELEQHNREITLLDQMGTRLQSCHTVDEAYSMISDFLNLLFPAESGALFALSTSRATLEAVATWGTAEVGEPVFAPDDCWALRRGRLYVVEDPLTEQVCPHLGQTIASSYLCVPLAAQGETLGILHLQRGSTGSAGTEAPRELLTDAKQQLAVTAVEHIALALANLKLRETLRLQSSQDPLTGLFNRRYLDDILERELRRADRKQRPLSIIRFDLDEFSYFNDTLGHETGDAILRQVGAWLQTHVRGEDVLGRYSGEEFLLILPDTPLEAAEQRADVLREDFGHLTLEHGGQLFPGLTLSTAVAAFPENGVTGETLLQTTDAYLTAAATARRESGTGPLKLLVPALNTTPASAGDSTAEPGEPAGAPPEAPTRLVVGMLALNLQTFELMVGDKTVRLTPVEFELLQFLMQNAGKVFTSERLLQEVWHYPAGTGSHESVRAHIKNLRAKIEPDPRQPIYLKTLGRFGYTVSAEESPEPAQS